jgi:hypothetical protein
MQVPVGILKLFRGAFDWIYESEKEEHTDSRGIYLARGKVSVKSYQTAWCVYSNVSLMNVNMLCKCQMLRSTCPVLERCPHRCAAESLYLIYLHTYIIIYTVMSSRCCFIGAWRV